MHGCTDAVPGTSAIRSGMVVLSFMRPTEAGPAGGGGGRARLLSAGMSGAMAIIHLPEATSSTHDKRQTTNNCANPRTTFCSSKAYPLAACIREKKMASDLPKNAHVSSHPCLQAKLSQLRSASTGCRDAQTLVHEIALMVGYEALGAGLAAQQEGTVRVSLPSNLQYQERKWGYTALQVYLANSIHTKHSY
jgi:hypothetical protein